MAVLADRDFIRESMQQPTMRWEHIVDRAQVLL